MVQLRIFGFLFLMENGINSGVSIKQHNPFPRTKTLCLEQYSSHIRIILIGALFKLLENAPDIISFC